MAKSSPRWPWIIVGLLWVVAMLNYLDRLLITSMREPIEASIPMSEAQFGLLTSVFLWAYGIVSPFGGFLADRFSRRRVILLSMLIWSVFTCINGWSPSFAVLLVSRIGMGISEACYLPAALAMIADYHRGSTRSLATGLHMSGLYAGTALGGVGGFMAEAFGWRQGFFLFGAFGILYTFVLLRVLRDADPPAGSETLEAFSPTPSEVEGRYPIQPIAQPAVRFGAAVGALLAVPAFGVLVTLNVFVGISNWLIYGWLPTFLREHFHLGLGAAGLSATGSMQSAAFIGVVVGGQWADRWSRTNPRARMIVPGIGYLCAAPALWLVASLSQYGVVVAGLLTFGLCKAFYDANLMPILRQVAPERYSATGYGIFNCTSCVASGFMTYAGGVLRDRHVDLSVIFQWTAASLLVTAVLLLFAVRRTPAIAAVPPPLSYAP